VEFARLAHTFEELEGTSSRLALIELLTQLFRAIERPEEVQQVCYLVQGRVAPFYVALEMGMAETSVTRSLAQAYHTTPEQMETALTESTAQIHVVDREAQARSVTLDARIDVELSSVTDRANARYRLAIDHLRRIVEELQHQQRELDLGAS